MRKIVCAYKSDIFQQYLIHQNNMFSIQEKIGILKKYIILNLSYKLRLCHHSDNQYYD